MQATDFVATLFDGSSNPDKVTVTFTMAVNALDKGHTATIILMAQAVELGKPGAAAGMAIGDPFKPVVELLGAFIDRGGHIAICKSCMVHNGLREEQMDPRFGIIGAPDVIDLLMAAKGTLQVT